MSSCIWKVTVWKPELHLNNVLITDGAQQVFLVARDVTETRVGSIIKALITQNIDDNPLGHKWRQLFTLAMKPKLQFTVKYNGF